MYFLSARSAFTASVAEPRRPPLAAPVWGRSRGDHQIAGDVREFFTVNCSRWSENEPGQLQARSAYE